MNNANAMTNAPAFEGTEHNEIHQQIAAANAAMAALESNLQQDGVVVSLQQQRMMSQFRAAVGAQLECASRLVGG